MAEKSEIKGLERWFQIFLMAAIVIAFIVMVAIMIAFIVRNANAENAYGAGSMVESIACMLSAI